MFLKAHPCSSRSLQIVAHILADTIQRQDENGCLPCPLLLAISCNFLLYLDDMRKQRMRQIQVQHPDLIHVLFRFLMRPRTVAEREALAAIPAPKPGECLCAGNSYDNNPFLRELHDDEGMVELTGERTGIAGRSALQIILCEVPDFLRLTINFAFVDHPLRKVMLRSHRQGAWPRDFDDVFPYGVAASMTSLCDWAVHSPRDCEVVRLAGALQTTVLGYPFLGHFARIIIPRAVLPGLTAKLRLLGHGTHAVGDAAHEMEILFDISYVTLNNILSLHNRQLRAAMIDDLDSLSHLGDLCLAAYHLMEKTLPQYPRLRTDWNKKMQMLFLQCHVRLRLLFDLPTAAGTPRLPDAILLHIKEKTSTNTVNQLVEFEPFRYSAICANPGCAQTRLSLGSSLAACSGCHYVSYCSRECQRAGWRHARFPHRDVCAKIDSLMKEVPLVREMGGSDTTWVAIDNEDAEHVFCHLEAIYLGPESIA